VKQLKQPFPAHYTQCKFYSLSDSFIAKTLDVGIAQKKELKLFSSLKNGSSLPILATDWWILRFVLAADWWIYDLGLTADWRIFREASWLG
jgi:hypothetical protein